MGTRLSTKPQILEAATSLFFQKGFEETTFADIAKRVGISQPAVYAHFNNKMDLLKHVAERAALICRDFIDHRINSHDRALDKLKSLSFANLDFFRNEKEMAQSILALYYFSLSAPELLEVFRLIQEKTIDVIENYIVQGQHEKIFNVKNTRKLASAIHSLLVGDCYKSIYCSSEAEAKKVKAAHWESIVALLKANF